MSTCNETLRAENKPYPRTCAKCGLGPCVGHPLPSPAAATAFELVHIVTWRYPDNSAFGVVSVHRAKASAERMVDLLKAHAETKRFDIETAPAEA